MSICTKAGIKTFKIEHIPQYRKVLIHFIDTSLDPCHVGVEVDVFYKLAFFLFWKTFISFT